MSTPSSRFAFASIAILVGTTSLVACATDESSDLADLSIHDRDLTDEQLLGKLLFEDTNLSEPRGQACGSCHDARTGFAGDDGSRVDGVAAGAVRGVVGTRNTPTAAYAMFAPPFHVETVSDGEVVEYVPVGGQFWDGRADTLADQAKQPFLNPREMNNPSVAALIAKVRAAKYAPMFVKVYGAELDDDELMFDLVARAIAAFESSQRFRRFSSPFDDYLRGTAPLPERAARGFALFKDPEKGNCIACHVGNEASRDPEQWLFTDFTYDNLGVPRNVAIPDNADPAYFDLGLCRQPGLAAKAPAGFDVEGACGAFKVPSLRNVAVTGPYMHNGYFGSLRDVVAFYATRSTNPERWYPDGVMFDDVPEVYRGNVNQSEPPYDRLPGETPRLSDDEIDAIVAFLESLTDR
ncbi:MAG TPA: cytochrome c peroxidase [Kofleriaceae bacterium]|nr:cytochrome c peroxidase [Kofleriaceae bacterium]